MIQDLGFNYFGDINLYYSSPKGVQLIHSQHNAGSNLLFKQFSKVLAGVAVDTVDLPKYIDIRYKIGSVVKSCLVDIIEINKKYGFYDDKYMTIVDAVLTYANLINDISAYDSRTYFSINLLSENKDLLASSQLSYDYLNRIKPGTQMLIEWKLYVTNPMR